MQNDHYEGALLEEIRDQNKAILEGLSGLKDVPTKLDKMSDDIEGLKNNMEAVKLIAKVHSGEINNLGSRVTKLENA